MASLTVEELLIKIGVDVSQASRIDDVVNKLGSATNKVGHSVNNIANSVNQAGQAATNAVRTTANEAEKSTSKVGGFKLALLAVAAAGAFFATRIIGSFNNAIAKTSELSKQKGKLFDISSNEIAQAQAYQGALSRTRASLDSLGTKIALNVVPAITKIVDAFNKWLVGNKELISKGLKVAIEVMLKAVQVVLNVVNAIGKVISSTVGWKNALFLLGAAWVWFNRKLLLSPMGLIIASIVAILLVVDDLIVYLRGGKSQFGEFWGACIEWLNKAKAAWDNLGDGTKSILKSLLVFIGVFVGSKGVLAMAISVAGMTKKVVSSIKLIGTAFKVLSAIMMTNPILAIIAAIAAAAYLIYVNWDWLSAWFKKLWTKISETLSDFVDSVSELFKPVISFITKPFNDAIDLVKGLFSIWGDDNKSFIDKLGDSFLLVTDFITKPFINAMKWIKDKFFGFIGYVGKKVKGLFSFLGFGGKESDIDSKGIDKFLDDAPINRAANSIAGGNSMATDNRTYNGGTVNLTQNITTQDPQKAASLSNSMIDSSLMRANIGNKTGVAY